MYQTYPKSSLAMVTAMLLAALALPAMLTFPNSVAETAAGLQIAICLWTLFTIRLVLLTNQQTWLDAIALPFFLIAAVAAMGYTPQDAVSDVLTRSGFVGLLIGAGVGLALFALRPKTLGFTINRQFWIVLAALAVLISMNHVFRFPQNPAAALVGDLLAFAALANVVAIGQVPSQGSKIVLALNVLSFCLFICTITWMTDNLANGVFEAATSVVILAVTCAALAVFYPIMERQMPLKHPTADD
jgi:hypothetical protein